ncbi:MAG: hypothetical protein VX235_01245 [Candidatus Thermoplasmatota archaeon]|jgi:hypothetical protein|nr:hypothetical protein [Candidatus Thermoplasmatota archaeon]
MEVTIMQRGNNTEQNETTTIVMERLPELDEEETSTALENTRWAAGFVGAPLGAIYNDAGVDLQVVSTRTVRCLAVADHPYCYRALAMMALSFETAGVELEVEPYTIIRPLPPEEEQDEQGSEDEDTGMEVA